MAAAANYALRQPAAARASATRAGSSAGRRQPRLDLVYDVSHNIAKIEKHPVDGGRARLCVHRKGATRALPPGHPALPADLRDVGQPVLIPGDDGHVVLRPRRGAGRAGVRLRLPRCRPRDEPHQAAKRRRRQAAAGARWSAAGIAVRGASWRGLAEEAPDAYKDVSAVIEAAERAGLGRKIARLVPVGVVKG